MLCSLQIRQFSNRLEHLITQRPSHAKSSDATDESSWCYNISTVINVHTLYLVSHSYRCLQRISVFRNLKFCTHSVRAPTINKPFRHCMDISLTGSFCFAANQTKVVFPVCYGRDRAQKCLPKHSHPCDHWSPFSSILPHCIECISHTVCMQHMRLERFRAKATLLERC